MKALTKLTLAGVLALASMSLASATAPTNEVFITGSTAYRGQVINAIHQLLSSGFVYAYAGSAEAGNAQIYQGTTSVAVTSSNTLFTGFTAAAGTPIIIATSWNGSGAGVANVADQVGASSPSNYIPYANSTQGGGSEFTMTTGGTSGLADPTSSTTSSTDQDSEVAHIAMCDVLQKSTGFIGNVTWADGTTHNYATLQDKKIGIVPFRFTTSNQSSFTNITTSQANALFAAGSAPLAQFTGNPGDTNTIVYAVGRNPDSGTRVTTQAEVGLGVASAVIQYQPQDSTNAFINGSTGGTIYNLASWPIETVNHVSTTALGNSGYTSGGNLANTIGGNAIATNVTVNGAAPTASGAILLAYLSTGDSTTASTGSNTGKILNYNGVTESTAAIQNGQYTFWSYEHLLYPSTAYLTGLSGGSNIKAVISLLSTSLITGIPAGSPTAAIGLNSMNASRAGDGAVVTHN